MQLQGARLSLTACAIPCLHFTRFVPRPQLGIEVRATPRVAVALPTRAQDSVLVDRYSFPDRDSNLSVSGSYPCAIPRKTHSIRRRRAWPDVPTFPGTYAVCEAQRNKWHIARVVCLYGCGFIFSLPLLLFNVTIKTMGTLFRTLLSTKQSRFD